MKKSVLFILIALLVFGSRTTNADPIPNEIIFEYGKRPIAIFCIPGVNNGPLAFNALARLTNGELNIVPLNLYNRVIPLKDIDKAPAELGRYTLAQDAEYLARMIQIRMHELRAFNPLCVIAGHSRGALLALMIKAKYKDLVDGLILLNPAAPSGISNLSWGAVKNFAYLIAYDDFWNKPVGRPYGYFVSAVLPDDFPPNLARELYEGLVCESGRHFYEMAFNKPRIDPAMVDCPVLVIAGKQDKLIPVKTAKAVAEMFNAEFAVFNTTHYPFLTTEGIKVATEIKKWVEKVRYIKTTRFAMK